MSKKKKDKREDRNRDAEVGREDAADLSCGPEEDWTGDGNISGGEENGKKYTVLFACVIAAAVLISVILSAVMKNTPESLIEKTVLVPLFLFFCWMLYRLRGKHG